MDELTEALDNVQVSVTAGAPTEAVPKSYTSNNKKERLLLQFSENFQRQFRKLYSDRKPLLLTPVNEYDVPKFICSTVKPTYLKYQELYEYDGCAAFVADYLNYVPLDIPNELPDKVVSPTLVLKNQKGNCFDYAILLTSLLIGVGYDAYCVCGYASQDVCLLNMGRNVNPQLNIKEEVQNEEIEVKKNRYKVRPLRDFSSAFEKRQKDKEQKMLALEKKKEEDEEAARIALEEAPPPDKFHGLRIHCWVLVLMGKRDVGHNFFIEPTTGMPHPLEWEEYQGIEVLWNHKNYWVNMQDCAFGVKNLSYDLGDAAVWEFFFPNVDKPLLVIPGEDFELKQEDSEDSKGTDKKVDFQLPPSWVLPIEISARDLESRCPKGVKTVLYYRSKEEKFAEYLNQDGLVTKYTLYSDTARKHKTEVRQYYKHRKDRLTSRVELVKPGQVCETFDPGRPRSLKVHTHYDSNPLRAGHRTLEFYAYARVDGLSKRIMTPTEMIEHYLNREDFLYHRHVTYEKLPKKPDKLDKSKPQQILKVVDKFHPNPALPANSDIAERTILVTENRIKVVYQLEEGRNTASNREFVVPTMNPDQAVLLTFDPDGVNSYQVDPYLKEPKNRHLFEQMEALVQVREDTILQIRRSEAETESILNHRMAEELNTALSISVYDVMRNETARNHRKELERKLEEEEKVRKEKEKDYLAPFLARIGDPPQLDKDQMVEVAQDCLKDLRTRLVDMANIIQGRFEKETEKLQIKQAWYKSMQGSLTKEEEGDYVTFCNDSMFTIHILEQRLNRHKMSAPQKYMELEKRLKDDPRVHYIYK